MSATVTSPEETIVALKIENAKLRRDLNVARNRQRNWLLRQRAWRMERDALLRRLEKENPSVNSEDEKWG